MKRSAIVLPLLALALLFLPGSRARSSSTFEPCAISSLASTAASAPSDITMTFGVQLDPQACAPFNVATERPGQYDVQKMVYFTPPQWHVAADSDIPDGTQVGTLRSRLTVGLLNNPCSIILNANFNLYEATIDRSNTVDANAPGSPDRLSPMAGPPNGVPNAATKWPSYLDNVAQMQGMDLSQLVARIVGVDTTDFIGTTLVTNLLVFRPGAHISSEFATDPSLGYPTVLIFQDPSATASSPGSGQRLLRSFLVGAYIGRDGRRHAVSHQPRRRHIRLRNLGATSAGCRQRWHRQYARPLPLQPKRVRLGSAWPT